MRESVLGNVLRDRRVILIYLGLCLCFVVHISTVKVFGWTLWDYDARFWYVGGQCWWNGDSPYNKQILTETWMGYFEKPPRDQATFVYPPTLAVISLPMALFPWLVASWLLRLANLLAIVGICVYATKLASGAPLRDTFLGPRAWYIGMCALLSSLTVAMFQGQLAPVVVCGCLAAWYGQQRRLLWLFLLGFLFASIKPQISMLPLLYVLFNGGHRWFLYGTGLCAAICAFMVAIAPEADLLGAYRESIGSHLTHQEFNHWDSYCGVSALLGGGEVGKYTMIGAILLGILGTAWVGSRHKHLPLSVENQLRHGQLVWIISFAAMPVHIYDLVGQMFITITLWVLPNWRRRVVAFACMVVADRGFALSRVLDKLGGVFSTLAPLVHEHSTPAMAATLLVLFFWWYWRDYHCLQAGGAVST